MSNQNQGKVLGELEADVMDIVWESSSPVSVREVTEILRKKRSIAYTTVMTIMSRLAEKLVLSRKLVGSNYLYQPKMSRERFVAKAAHRIFTTAVSTLGEGVISHFVKEIVNLSPKKRKELLGILDKE